MASNKNKIISSVMAITTVMGTIMEGTMAVTAVNVNKDELWSQAYAQTMKAKKTGLQEDINVAREAINALSEGLGTDKELRDQLIGTLSAMIDPVQQNLFVKLYEIIYEKDMVTKKKNLSQEQINDARSLIKGFAGCKDNQPYLPSWSTAIDEFQQVIINEVIKNMDKVKSEYQLDDIENTTKLINEFLKVKDNDSMKLKAQELNIEFLSAMIKGGKIIEFRKTYSSILLKKNEDLTLDDKKSVQAAVDLIDMLSEDLKSILSNEFVKLKEQKKVIDALGDISIPSFPNTGGVILNLVEEFKKDYAEILRMEPDDSSINFKSSIEKAIQKFNSLSKSDKSQLKKEEEKLNSLINYINQFIEKSVFTFKTNYRELLNKTVDTVTLSDKAQITNALNEFQNFHSDIKSKLINEAEILTKFNAKLNGDLLCELNVSVKGKMVTVSGTATEYDSNGMILIVKDDKGDMCYFDQIIMDSQGKFSTSFDFTNNMLGVENITAYYQVCMRVTGSDSTSKELNFSIENIVKLEVEEFQARNKDVVVDMSDKNVKIGDDVRIKEVLAEIDTLSPAAQLVLKDKKAELEKLLVIIAGKDVDKEVADFKETYKSTLALTVQTVKVTDRENVEGALEAYGKLSKEATLKLENEKSILDGLLQKINQLRIQVDADAFKTSYKEILGKTIDNIALTDKVTVEGAIAKYDDLQQASKDIVDKDTELTTHGPIKEHLQKLMDKITALNFKETHKSILNKAVADITLDDEEALKKAENEYASLNDVSKTYLVDEAKKLEDIKSEVERLKAVDKLTKTITSAKSIKKVEEPDSEIKEGSKIVGSWTIFQECIVSAEKVPASDTIENINKAIGDLETAIKTYENSNVKLIDGIGVVDGRVNGKVGDNIEVKIPLEDGESLRQISKDTIWNMQKGKWVNVGNKGTTIDSVILECIAKTLDEDEKGAEITFSIENGQGNVIKIVQLYLTITEKTAEDKVNEFKNAHKAAFALTSDSVTIDNETIIKTAISEYEKLTDASLKSALSADIENLNSLLGVISTKKVEKFKTDFSTILALTPENVALENRADILVALSAYEGLDESAKNGLASEKSKLDALKSATDAAAVEKDAQDFMTKYETVLNLTVDTVAIQHKASVEDALRDFNAMQQGSKDIVGNENGVKLKNLSDKIAQLENQEAEKIKVREELNTLIENNKGKCNAQSSPYEGSYIGSLIEGSKDILQSKIDEANAVIQNGDSTLQQLKDGKANLEAALMVFEESMVEEVVLASPIHLTGKIGDKIEVAIPENLLNDGETFGFNVATIYDEDWASYGNVSQSQDKFIISCTKVTGEKGELSSQISILNKDGKVIKGFYIYVTINE